MVVTPESTPFPSWLRIVTRSQGMEFASGEGELATALPITRLPSFASQEGPAKCLPNEFAVFVEKLRVGSLQGPSELRGVTGADVDLVPFAWT